MNATDWLFAPVCVCIALYGFWSAWLLRPFRGNPHRNARKFAGSLALAIGAVFVLSEAIWHAGMARYRAIWIAVVFPAAVVYFSVLALDHFDRLRSEWAEREAGPDPADFPTIGWWRTAALSFLSAFALSGIAAKTGFDILLIFVYCSFLLAGVALPYCLMARLNYHLIRRWRSGPTDGKRSGVV